MGKKAIVAGATGLIGSQLMDILLSSDIYDEVLILVRKKLDITHPKLTRLVVDFDQIENHSLSITGDAVFSCLGTTRKKTPDRNTYYKIDHDYPLRLAKLAKANGVKQFHLVSSIGANPNSGTFYIKLKGETERDISALNFYSSFMYEPSMLTGREYETRFGEVFFEELFKILNHLLIGKWKKYHSVSGAAVAKAMYDQSLRDEPGKWIVQFEEGIAVKKIKS
ncbi:MAG TPA: nucleoside-diphosphate sugar epimerase [Chitinophagaceae bacterium]|nr:nucleoside-diphosphate sugar epimerase [Chitinophagaceae bacterium]